MEYTQLKRSLERLDEMRGKYATAHDYDAVIADALRESLAQRFEYTLETAWKTCKRHLSEQGFMEAATGSPKSICGWPFPMALLRMLLPGFATSMPDRTPHMTIQKKNLIMSLNSLMISLMMPFPCTKK